MGRLYDTTTTQQTQTGLQTLPGLQAEAEKVGVGTRAKEIIAEKGEDPQKIFSGGFISDTFDSLNLLQHGVTGVLKGKGFMEGVKTRQSFSDKDSLGDYGIPGTIAGIALDIAVDPLTYIAPATIFKKIPGATKAVKAIGNVVKDSAIGQSLGTKFIYRFGQDPIYKELAERTIKNIGVSNQNLLDIARPLTKLDSIAQKAVGDARKAGNLESLTPDILAKAKPAFDELDRLGKEAVDVGLLKAETYAENVGKYIARLYRTKEVPEEGIKKATQFFGKKPLRIDLSRFKKRQDIPEEIREAMGEILEAGYPTAKGLVQMNEAIEKTKFFNEVAAKWGTNVAQEGMEKLPTARGLFTTSQGEIIASYDKIKNLNKNLNPLLKQLKSTFKADRTTLSEISDVERNIGRLSEMRKEEFFKFFSEGEQIIKTFPASVTIKGVGKLPERVALIGREVERFKTFDEMLKSEVGIRLEKIYEEGLLERAGFKDATFIKGGKEITTTGMKQFFNFVKKPFKARPEKTKEVTLVSDIEKLIKAQKGIENLSEKLGTLTEIDKRSINDSFRFLEETINKIRFEKEGIVENIDALKLGTLAGKYVPKPIFDDIQELTRPYDKTLSKQLMAGFKYGKVILSPPTHARNVISNFILNHFEGLSPARVDIYSEAAKELSTKGKWYQEAQKVGLGLDTFAAKELKDILEIEAKGVLGKIKGGADKIANLYQKEEEFAKLAQYIFQRKKGLISEEAWKIAERATFNYAQVTPFIRKLRENIWGFPFITFTYKVTPQVAKTIATKPTKISNIGKIKNAIENMADLPELQRERASEPDWIRDGFYVKLPMKDKFGRSAYFDLTYILPFGDLMSGQLLERGVERETGLPESQASAALRKTPLFNVMRELYRNQDFYGNKIWKNSDTQEQQLGDLMLHLVRTYAPPLVGEVLPGGIKPSGERRPTIFGRVAEQQREAVEAGRAQPRTIAQEAIRLLGLKVQPIDIGLQEKYGELEKRKAIESLLQDEGAIQKFQKYFIPKDKPSGRRLYR